MNTKVPVTLKIALMLAAICYVLTIYSFFTHTTLVVLVFFILHSVFMVFSIYMAVQSRADSSEFQAMSDSIERLEAEKTQLEEGLTRSLQEKEESIDRLQGELDNERTANLSNIQGNKQLKDAYNSLIKVHEDLKGHVLLPDLSGTPDSPIDIIEVARSVIGQMKEYSSLASLNVNISSTEGQLLLMASRAAMEILFRNIIDNSIKYVRRAGNLVITLSAIGNEIFIVCKDNGEGLSEAETQHIFELNFQGSNRISGNGLGLAQAKAIVDYYGGSIYAKSIPGRGMGIYIQLPAA